MTSLATPTPYQRVWRGILDSSRKAQWNMILMLVELLFTMPISNAKVERLFSLMNRIKTDCHATLSESTLNNLITIHMEGPEFQDYNPTPAIQAWLSSAARRPNQRPRKNYKSRDSTTTSTVLIEESSTDESADEEEADSVGVDDGRNMLIRELDELS